MVVQHNLTAMNSNRTLNIVSNDLSKTSEKLSSGYKINRATENERTFYSGYRNYHVGRINFYYVSSKAASESIQKISAVTITNATYSTLVQKDALTATNDLYPSDGTLVVEPGWNIIVNMKHMNSSVLDVKNLNVTTEADAENI